MHLKFLCRLMLVLLMACPVSVIAKPEALSLNLQEAGLSQTIRLLAELLKINVMISENVSGMVSLQIHDADVRQAFNTLLLSHGLAVRQMGNIWFVAPRAELISYQKDEMKWREVWEATAPLVTRLMPIQYASAEDILKLLQDDHVSLISKRGLVQVDLRTNTLIVRDLPDRAEAMLKIIRNLDVPVKQIQIDARLASVDSDKERELGIDFMAKQSRSVRQNVSAGVTSVGRYSIAVARLADGSLLDVKLAALENEGSAELISSPSLFTANRQTASIEAGEEVPYQEVSESGGTAVAFKKAVLGLKVTPHILPGNRVLLSLQINQDRPGVRMVQGMPTIRTRQIITSVLLKSGQTVVLGGIFETSDENGQRRLPFVSQWPLIGPLFRQQTARSSKRELLIFVTPKMMAQQR